MTLYCKRERTKSGGTSNVNWVKDNGKCMQCRKKLDSMVATVETVLRDEDQAIEAYLNIKLCPACYSLLLSTRLR